MQLMEGMACVTAGKSRKREVGLLLINAKGSAKTSLSNAEAPEEALCFGWFEASQTNAVIWTCLTTFNFINQFEACGHKG